MDGLSEWTAALLLTGVEVVADASAKYDNLVVTLVGYNALGYILTRVLAKNRISVTNA